MRASNSPPRSALHPAGRRALDAALAAIACLTIALLPACAGGASSDAAELYDLADGGAGGEAGPSAEAPDAHGTSADTGPKPAAVDAGTATVPDTGTTSAPSGADSAVLDSATPVAPDSATPAMPDSAAPAEPDGAMTCPSGDSVCAGVCTDTEFDPSNCGACGAACATDGYCESGRCCTGSVGTCSHPLCAVGLPLVVGCENTTCTSVVCNQMPSCCTGTWDAACVAEAKAACHLTCTGGC